ncbi:MAG TPA: pseudouridine synthase [Planctomycetota bacterium]|nr:pseudouridine synthase [Planctomycetota bacterium]
MNAPLVRLNRLLAERGAASRRHADELVRKGLVSVDGRVVTAVGTRVPADARLEVSGRLLPERPRVHLVLNKPPGVLCTNAPGEQRPRAIDLVRAPAGVRLFCVGRLDLDSRGLLFLTNDGDFAARVLHPRHGVPRTYWMRVRGRVTGEALAALARGVRLAEGRTGPIRVSLRRRTREWSLCLATVREGMNRELRRAFAHVGFPVLDLTRTRIGPVSIRGLRPGASRPLTPGEIAGLLRPPEAGDRGGVGESRGGAGEKPRRPPRVGTGRGDGR